jgi:SAM-dependent methyltransferase
MVLPGVGWEGAMTESYSWVPDGVDVTVPNASRVYDYALGGVHNFRVDREFWERAMQAFPDASLVARANRAFLGRAVRRLAESGVRQFLDIGSGIPTLGNVHEVAQGVDPSAKVAYVDIDPVAVEQSRSLLVGNPYARAVRGDLREPEKILYDPQVADFLDFSRPIAVLTVAVLHFIPDSGDPASLVARIGAELVEGSYLVLSHLGPETRPEARAKVEEARKLYDRTPTPVVERTPEQLRALIGDAFELVPPGVVTADEWHPDPDDDSDVPAQPAALVAVARKR